MPSAPARAALLRRLLLLGFGIAVGVQAYVLYVPKMPGTLRFPQADKVVHALIFAAPVFLGLLLDLTPWLVVGLFSVHAPVSEVIQRVFLPDRSGSAGDVAADVAGVLLGVAAAWAFGRLLSRRAGP